ncbi:MAG: DUF4355 domain-containing protein [Candidatus Micrarchaeia archaeon]
MQQDISKTFTQDEVNRIVKGRLAREREKYKDYEVLGKRVKEMEEKEKEKASMPELERMKAELEEMKRLVSKKDEEARRQAIYNLKLELLEAEGLPKYWAKRILGETED